MAMFEYPVNAANKIRVDEKTIENVCIGTGVSDEKLTELVLQHFRNKGNVCLFGFDGNYAVQWKTILDGFTKLAAEKGITVRLRHINEVFQPLSFIRAYKKPNIEHDPSLGYEKPEALVQDIMDMDKVASFRDALLSEKEKKVDSAEVLIVYAPGTCIKELIDVYDYRFYFDMSKDPIMWNLWGGTLVPFGCYEPDPDYFWKDLYYVDFHMLDNQKWFLFENMDFYVEAVDPGNMTLIPRESYDTIMSTLLHYPIKQVRTFMPGAFGGYRYKQLWPDVPDPGNSAWNSISSPKCKCQGLFYMTR